MNWRLMMASIPVLMALMLVYLAFRVHRFSWMQALSQRSRALAWILSFVLPALCVLPFLLFNTITAAAVLLHLFFFWLVCDLAALIRRRLRKRDLRTLPADRESAKADDNTANADRGAAPAKRSAATGAAPAKRYLAGYAAIAITIAYLAVGWINAHHIRQTGYTLTTEKALSGAVRVALIADSHLGVTLDGERFEALVQRIQADEPDLLVIVGDYVDDDSPQEDMLDACRALGTLKTTYGVYFVYGNHDNGYYRYRSFDSAKLAEALTENGVAILRDDIVELPCGITLIGRQDRSLRNRKSASELTEALDKNRYILMLDHQPNDYDAEAASGADLVLSGHTHGGHIFPAGPIGLLIGANDRIYGYDRRQSTDFIITSGVSGWAVPFKTGTFSEYVLVDIQPPG